MHFGIEAIIIAFVQGITEWLPVSSSGHIVLLSSILNYDNTIVFDVALHFGTLMAVFVYFGKDIVDILEALLKGKWDTNEGKMAFLLIVASIPAAVIGFLFKKYFEIAFGSLLLVGMGFGITGLFLIIASLDFGKERKKIPSYMDSFLIGCAQALAIFPGISRSGSTIASGLLRGLDEKSALKFSFLMAIPAIFGASLLELGSNELPSSLILPTFVSFAAGMLSIHLLFKVVLTSKRNLRWFGIYTLLLALGILAYLLFF
jgi:undecaprenyl-diphosphatase